MRTAHPEGITAPHDQQDDHDRGHIHDTNSLLARFGYAFHVLPPEVDRHEDGKNGCGRVCRQDDVEVCVVKQFVQKPRQVEASGYAADGAREDVVEHQRGDGKLGEQGAHALLYHAIHAAADEHAAAFVIERLDGE